MVDLIQIKSALSLRGDDPLWMILYALGYYKAMYKQIPVEINAALARTEAVIAQFDAVKWSEGWFFRWLGRFGQTRILWCSLVVLVLVCALGFAAGRSSVEESTRRLGELNGGGQSLLTCFNGVGRLEARPDGHTYCFPVSAEGKTFGFVVR